MALFFVKAMIEKTYRYIHYRTTTILGRMYLDRFLPSKERKANQLGEKSREV
jgi:hypothetical protein